MSDEKDARRISRTLKEIERARAWHFKGLRETYGELAYRCFYCGIEGRRVTRDHVLPVSLGGQTCIENLVPACVHCNQIKGNTHPLAWFMDHPRFAYYFLKYATRAEQRFIDMAMEHAGRFIVVGSLWGDAEW